MIQYKLGIQRRLGEQKLCSLPRSFKIAEIVIAKYGKTSVSYYGKNVSETMTIAPSY